MKMQELMNSMKEILEEIKDVDPDEDVTEILKKSKLGELYEECLNDDDVKDIPNKRAARKPAPNVDELAKMMM